jgi:alanine transaminase
MYAISLLKSTGICVVPASGFGQAEGRYGFRTTFLPPMADMEDAMKKFKSHHEAFVKKYT